MTFAIMHKNGYFKDSSRKMIFLLEHIFWNTFSSNGKVLPGNKQASLTCSNLRLLLVHCSLICLLKNA